MTPEFPKGLIPCDEVLLCTDPEPCSNCPDQDPRFPANIALPKLVKGRHYRAKGRSEESMGEPAWFIPELDSEPYMLRCGCGLHFGFAHALRCAKHFGHVDENGDEEVAKKIKSLGSEWKPVAPVRVPDLEDA